MKDNLMFENTDYRIFFEFIKNYSGRGFANIDNQDQSIIRLNRILSRRRQFFYIADLLKFKILYTSPQILDIFGVSPEDYDLSHNFRVSHPLDIERRSRVRVKVIESGQELFIRKSGNKIISSSFRMKNITGVYSDIFMQSYLFYCNSPIETVYILMVHTPITLLLKKFKRGYYQWYAGNDLNNFRYPDEELLLSGSALSERELEVLSYIRKGLSSKEIGEKLSLSSYTVNTHRRNILKKYGKSSIGEVVYDLESIGII